MKDQEFLDNINNKHPTLLSDAGISKGLISYMDFIVTICVYIGFEPSNYGNLVQAKEELYDHIMNMTEEEIKWLRL